MPKKSVLDDLVTPQEMRQHVKDGLTDAQIGNKYFVTASTVYKYRERHGIKKHRTKIVRDVDSYYRMKNCLLTDEQVAYIWNISRRALGEWKKSEGLDGVALQVVDRYADGTPVMELIVRKEKTKV